MAKIIAVIVRNNMENFHIEHLTDAQMAELNPLIRNGIYSGLMLFFGAANPGGSDASIEQYLRVVPSYWEEPELIKDL